MKNFHEWTNCQYNETFPLQGGMAEPNAQPRAMMLSEFKKAVQGRKLFVRVQWGHNKGDDEYFPMSVASFLSKIGADVAHYRDGIHPATPINAAIGPDKNVYVD